VLDLFWNEPNWIVVSLIGAVLGAIVTSSDPSSHSRSVGRRSWQANGTSTILHFGVEH